MQTHFGFKKVLAEEKAGLVGDIFSSVASSYDVMNDLMSFGLHRLWKDKMAGLVNPASGAKIIDVAGGTGDIAFRIYEKAKKAGRELNITIADINPEMLEEGRKRAVNRNILKGIEWLCCDGENIKLPSNSFDYYTIAFGIRNFTNISKGLEEAYRLLKPGGQFICLEFAPLPEGILQKIYDLYSFKIIPLVGEMVTKNRDAYQYLVESIRKFPPPDAFAKIIGQVGFTSVKIRPFNFGVVNIHSGWKI